MSRIIFDTISEETLNSSKVARGPKSAAALLGLTEENDKVTQKNRKLETVNNSEEIRARNERDALENIKLQLYNAIEEAGEESAETRINGFTKIADILIHNYIPEIVDNRKLGITELVEKSMKHVKYLDQAVASRTAVLLVIQLGNQYDRVQIMIDYIIKAASDISNDANARAECCSVLGVLFFLLDDNIDDLEKVMTMFEDIFNIGNKAAVSEYESTLHSTALFSWGLLFTKVSSKYSDSSALQTLTNYLIKLLESPHLNLRVAAGEVLCIILEHSRSKKITSLTESIEELVGMTKFLSHDAQKFRHKHDLKTQRATFRDISRYIESNIMPDIKVVFGVESIEINTWALHQQYVALCSIIGPGIVTHLIQNEFIRNALNVDEIRMPLYKKSYKHELHHESDRMRTLERRDDRRHKADGLEQSD